MRYMRVRFILVVRIIATKFSCRVSLEFFEISNVRMYYFAGRN